MAQLNDLLVLGRTNLIGAVSAPGLFTELKWTGGSAAGPIVSITIGGVTKTATIPSASQTASGIVTTGAQSINGSKTFTSGHIYLGGSSAGSSTGNTTQLVFGTSSENHVAVSANDNALVINPTTSSTTNQIVLYLNQASVFPSGISANVTGNLNGNATTATGFASAKTIALTGNITGSATGGNGSNGWSIATTIGAEVVTNAMLAGSIANGKLANSSITIAGTSVSLGGSIAGSSLTGLDANNLSSGTVPMARLLKPTSGSWFNGGVVCVGADGVAEYGRYIDFHQTSASTNDYDLRIDSGTAAAKNIIYLPDLTGQVVIHTNNTKIGSSSKPVYVAASGAVTACSYDFLRHCQMTVPFGTAIAANADLNTITYLTVGNFYCSSNATVETLTNCPTNGTAFMMVVYSPLSTTIDNESTKTWCYRVRKIMTYTGHEWIQYVYSGSTAGSFTYGTWKKKWREGDAITGAVWNDYAEYRESDCLDFGYVLSENGDDTLSKTAERLQHFAGISSDTWGFAQGETEKAKTPIAVAGRVLAYPFEDRDSYQPGDVVCAAAGGTVSKMSREEVRDYPDRIVGTVSCVPDYEEWGQGEGRAPVKVNGRIWIKVR